ncbi:protein of unknown function [Candidatus Nitrospira inopinata]|uniref:Uncharacterized protein n=1 Tax=Candidatus Nitrospira inopinata TaxID=1715989 RepID=A0A0S4KV13_9BACT|nr:protein of unknown function [Candidatus Nitrospira inopinata]
MPFSRWMSSVVKGDIRKPLIVEGMLLDSKRHSC